MSMMQQNRMDSTRDSNQSTFKMPMPPRPPPSQSESLLFNDIIEEKTLALRSTLNEFLQVQPYRKFDIEFNNFMKRTKRIIQESQRTGADVSRIPPNSSQISQAYSRPSASFNYRPLTPMSMTSSTNSNRNSMLRLTQNSFQPIEQPVVNPFKPPMNGSFEPRVVLPRIDHSLYSHHISPSYATVIEVNQVENETARSNNVNAVVNVSRNVNYQFPEPEVQAEATTHNTYADVTVIENIPASSSQQNYEHDENNDASNSIESLLDGVGFKILVGAPGNSHTISKNNATNNITQEQNRLNVKENLEKYLSTWSVNMKVIKSQSKSSKVIVQLTGTLLEKDKKTVIEKRHEAGIMETRKENTLIKTNNGVYRLVGNVIGGHPNELYQSCLAVNGIPRLWRSIVKELSGVQKPTKNAILDFSLDSPAGPGPIIQKKRNQIDMSMTRKGTHYNTNTNVMSQKTNGKRKFTESDVSENSKSSKNRKFHDQLPPLLASTPKRPKKQPPTMFETPSQILKNKFHQNLQNKGTGKSNSRTMNTVNDSIHLTKKRQSNSREQTSLFLKPKAPVKSPLSSNNSTKRSRLSGGNSSTSINESKQTSITKNRSKQSPINKNQSKQSPINKNQSKQSPINKNQSKQSPVNKKQSKQSPINKNQSKQTSIIKTQSKQTSILQNQSKRTSINKSSIMSCSTSTQSRDKSSLKSTENSLRISKQNSSKRVISPIKGKKTETQAKREKLIKDQVSSFLNTSNKDTCKVDQKKNKQCSNIVRNTNVPAKKPKKQGKSTGEVGLFDDMEDDDILNISDFDRMQSPTLLSIASRTDKSRSETPPLFKHHMSSTGKSLACSEPPSPLSKSVEAKALKRVKAPKITVEEELKNNRKQHKNKASDFNTVSKKINQMLQFGEPYDNDDD